MTTYFRDSLIVIKLNYLNRPWMCFKGFASCLFSSLLGSYWVGRTRQRLIGSTTWCPKRTTTNVWGTSSAARAWSPVYLTWVGYMFTMLTVSTKSHQICSWAHRFEVHIGSPIYLLLLWLERIITSFWVCGWLCVLRAEMATWRATSLQVLQLPS